MKKIVFAGTPEIAQTCLQSLLDAGYEIQACLTQPDRPKGRGRVLTASPVKQLALQHKIPVYQPDKLSGSNVAELLRQLESDLMVVVAYGMIIPKSMLAIPNYGCINVHTSLLPRWRGAAPIQQAILAGDAVTGVTIMQMDPGLDTGDILTQATCSIPATMTAGELYQELSVLGARQLLETLTQIWAGEMVPIPQPDVGVTYAHKINKHDGAIDWQQSALEIERRVRAFNPWPVAFATLQTVQLRIWRAQVLRDDSIINATKAGISVTATANESKSGNILTTTTDGIKHGTILAATTAGIAVATGQGVLLLTEVQLPGKKAMPVHEVLHSQQQLFAPGGIFL